MEFRGVETTLPEEKQSKDATEATTVLLGNDDSDKDQEHEFTAQRTSPSNYRQAPSGDVTMTKQRKRSNCACSIASIHTVAKGCFHVIKSDLGLVSLLLIYAFLGAAVFVYIEGEAEDNRTTADLEEKKMEKRSFVDAILNLTRCKTRGDDDDDEVLAKIENFLNDYDISPAVKQMTEQVSSTVNSTSPMKQWTYFKSLLFCGTVFTTVGYGHIYPMTDIGRIVTMIYAAIGIPLCLVVLTKLGKTLTRAMKFLWSFVRRLYYTGSCFRIRNNVIWRKLSFGEKLRLRRLWGKAASPSRKLLEDMYVPYDIDDNFNLPPIIALTIAFLYIVLGALMYTRWENWTFLEAFYFTFTSLATIGFGDVLPSHPNYFLAAGAYILIGLSLIAMVINVIMEAVSETIVKATDQVMLVGNKVKEVKERIIKDTPVGRLIGTGPSSTPPLSEVTNRRNIARPRRHSI